jgi:peroxiredoxin
MKKYIALLALLGLVGWGVYDTVKQQSQNNVANQTTPLQKNESTANHAENNTKGAVAPDFTLSTLDGKKIKLSDLRGKTVILNFWATWCPPCRAEIPDLEKFYQKHQNQGVVILAVNLTSSEKNREGIAEFIKQYNITYPVVLDPDNTVANLYQAESIPTSYFIDAKGVVQQKFIGAMSSDLLEEMIAKIK